MCSVRCACVGWAEGIRDSHRNSGRIFTFILFTSYVCSHSHVSCNKRVPVLYAYAAADDNYRFFIWRWRGIYSLVNCVCQRNDVDEYRYASDNPIFENERNDIICDKVIRHVILISRTICLLSRDKWGTFSVFYFFPPARMKRILPGNAESQLTNFISNLSYAKS